ncbi:hypothetical protein LguiA_009782 [Lonicera macranthoides]
MKNYSLHFIISISLCFCICSKLIWAADSDNLQDTCPTSMLTPQTIFMNGFPCKHPASITAEDFKTTLLKEKGKTDNFVRSATTIVTAADFAGLNTLGLAAARTDLDMDGLVMPHSHPRASEILFVSKGTVVAGFIDTNNQLFQRVVKEGDVFVFPRGLLHYCLNAGFEAATVFSVLNSQNPGMVSIADAMFAASDLEAMKRLRRRLVSLSTLQLDRVVNVSLFEF